LALAAALDDWAAVRRDKRKDADAARRLSAAARLADPDPWRRDLRDTLDHPEQEARLAALRALAKAARFEEHGPISLDLLGRALASAGDTERAQAVLRAALHYHPVDVWINYDLAQVLEKTGRREEAIRCYAAARAIRPETAHSLAHALSGRGESDEAIAVLRDLVRLRPEDSRHLGCLGRELKARGRSREADAALDAAHAKFDAVKRSRSDFWTHYDLGYVLLGKGRLDEGIAESREAIRLRPEHAAAHHNLASALLAEGRLDEAIAESRETVRLQPDLAKAHNALAWALATDADPRRRDPAEALKHARKAVERKPNDGDFHNTLGTAEYRAGNWGPAIAALRKSMELRRGGDASDWFFLSLAQKRLGRDEEAGAWFDKAVIWTRQHSPPTRSCAGSGRKRPSCWVGQAPTTPPWVCRRPRSRRNGVESPRL
jgi:tetratricopeptide (TPR) repeat protein